MRGSGRKLLTDCTRHELTVERDLGRRGDDKKVHSFTGKYTEEQSVDAPDSCKMDIVTRLKQPCNYPNGHPR